MKKSTLPALLIAIFTLIILASPTLAQTKTFQWLNWDIDIVVNEDGSMDVTETQTLDFKGAPFTFGFRSIPVGSFGNNDGISNISVREGDRIFQESSFNDYGTFEVLEEGNEVIINWYFEPALGVHTYTFSYTVHGAIRTGTSEQGSGDQIFWTVIPSDHPSTVSRSRTTITLPEGVYPQRLTGTDDFLVAAYLNDQQTDELEITVSEDGRVITFQTNWFILSGNKLDVRVQVPHGLLAAPTPEWQAEEQLGDAIGLGVIAASILVMIGGPLAVIALWYTRGRDPKLGIVVPDYITEPPDDLPPAMVGSLIDERVDMQDIVSTMIDLARRGYLTMEEGKSKSFTFTLTDKSNKDLRPYERKFLQDLFGGKESRTLSSLQYKFANKIPNLRNMILDELVNEGYMPAKPPSVRNGYMALAVIVAVLGVLASFLVGALVPQAMNFICFPLIAFILVGVALLFAAQHMPKKTAKGTEAAAKWEAFKKYLKNIRQYTDIESSGDIFEKYLGYAVAFGLERSFINTFSKSPTATIPPWYSPYPPIIHTTGGGGWFGSPRPASGGGTGSGGSGGSGGGMPNLGDVSGGLTGGLSGMSSSLTRMLNNTSNVLRSTPPPANTGGSRSGSFGGGFSGGSSGGFSGGSSGGGGSAGFG